MATVVACLGDSITEGSPYWSSRGQTGDPQGQWQHWAGLLHPGLDLRNFGVLGERTDEIALRFEAAVRGVDALIVQGGINDVAQGRGVRSAFENLRELVERGRALGLAVAVCDVLPWNNGGPGSERAIGELNALIRSLDVPLLPFQGHARGFRSPGPHGPRVDERRRRPPVRRRLPPSRRARVPAAVGRITNLAPCRFCRHAESRRASARGRFSTGSTSTSSPAPAWA
ncbi:MAG: SGNH/GDSL hydrolase family protein [Gaiellaceae bacterium]